MSKAKAAKTANSAGSRRARPQSRASVRAPRRAFLHVTVLQNGVPQIEARLPTGGLLGRAVRIGRARRAELFLPFAQLPDAVRVFRVRRGRASAFVDPRFEGFLNDGTRFGSVREFIAPRGSLRDLATVLEPLEIPLHHGARGALRFADYEILFRVDDRQDARALPPRVVGASRDPFSPPAWNDPVERWAPWVGALAAGLVFVPLVGWLLKAPQDTRPVVGSLPMEYVRELIHPDHYAVLPHVFRERLDTESPTLLAYAWVDDLHARWHAAEEGLPPTRSGVAFLSDYPAGSVRPMDIEALERRARAAYGTYYAERDQRSDDRYFQVLKDYPRVVTSTAGEARGSLFVRQARRIQRMRATMAAVRSEELAEQDFLADFYAQMGVEGKERFVAPKMRVVTDPPPHADFALEESRRGLAAAHAAAAGESEVRARLVKWAEAGAKGRAGVVWLGADGALAPALLSGRLRLPADGADNLVGNARYAAGLQKLPPPLKPRPVINMMDVDSLVFGKREELRACYEAALRRDKGLGGTVEWSLEVDLSGSLRGVRVARTEIKDREFLLCLQERMKAWSFPPPKNGAITFRYPFRFQRDVPATKDP